SWCACLVGPPWSSSQGARQARICPRGFLVGRCSASSAGRFPRTSLWLLCLRCLFHPLGPIYPAAASVAASSTRARELFLAPRFAPPPPLHPPPPVPTRAPEF